MNIIYIFKYLIMMLFRNLLYQIIIYNLMLIINKYMILYLDTIYIYTSWSMITIWILSDSFIINNDLNVFQSKYNELNIKYNDLLKDFTTNIKDKHNQINVLCDTLSQHTIVIADCRNEIINLKNKIILLKPNYKSSPLSSSSSSSPKSITMEPVEKAETFNKFHDLHLKMKGRLQEHFFSKSCVF